MLAIQSLKQPNQVNKEKKKEQKRDLIMKRIKKARHERL